MEDTAPAIVAEHEGDQAKRVLEGEANAKATGPHYPTNFFGKHRMSAAITNLQSQINAIQEELDQVEALGKSSAVCQELISSVESIPDPLLPSTMGPADVSWDRWFRGAHNSKNQKRWI
ncbi:guanine nucleotide-binding protein subunit gamma 2-like [Castanea sativa]|uniref:guanine nucleotide-binding protein subunit gamma 2-like n=1 Tax=Castanea sativa TaxID=21020 RepID=UPI003F64C65C